MPDFKDDRFFLEISDQKGQPIALPDSERKVKIFDPRISNVIVKQVL